MKILNARWMSFILILSLCISLWSPVGVGVVSAEEGSSTDNGEAEAVVRYEVVLLDEKGQELTSLGSLDAGDTMQLSPRVKVISEEAPSTVVTQSDESDLPENTTPTYLENATFTYASSDDKVVTVSEAGLVTAQELSTQQSAEVSISWVSEEDSTVTATATYGIVVNAVPVSGVEVSRARKTIIVNQTYDISSEVRVLPEAAEQGVTYSTNDATVATVNENGVITAVKEGKTTITVASVSNPDKKAVMEVEVIDIPVALELNKTAHSMKATEMFQLEAVVVYASGAKKLIDATLLTYLSEDETVAKVNGNGLITGMIQTNYPKTTSVKVTYSFEYMVDGVFEQNSVVASCQVTVTKIPVEQIVIENEADTVTLKINEKYTLVSHVLPTNATNQTVSYKSSNKNVAKVSGDGVITATGIGEAVITAYSKEDSSVKDTFLVKVYQTVFNIVELGVDGTDTTNDATKINKILKYATKIDEPITVVVPKGTYYINSVLTIYDKTNLVLADKAVIKRFQNAGDSTMLVSSRDGETGGYGQCKDIVITGGTWDGNATGKGKTNGNIMYFGHAQNITINNTTVKNASGVHLIEFAGVKNALVENVELYGYTMCPVSNATEADKEAIQIDYCSATSAPAMKPHDGTACDTITIRNCKIHDYMAGVGTHTEGSKASTNIRIENNTFTNITNACINLRKMRNVIISNNTAKNCTTFVYASNSDGQICNNKVANGTSFKPKTSSGLRAKNGITVSNGSTFTIEKNTFEKAKSNGICVWNGSTATIRNNKIKNNKLYGIRTQGSTITLKKNSFSKNKSGVYDTYKDATIQSSDDIRAYFINIKASYKYKGKAVKPKIKLKNLDKKYYRVTYKNNKKPGTATVIIKGRGKVKQTLKIKYKIKK